MSTPFKMKGMDFGNSPVLKNGGVANSKVTSKDTEYEISIRKMMKDPNWNQGKKKSDYTPAELARIEDPRYQKMLSKIIGENE